MAEGDAVDLRALVQFVRNQTHPALTTQHKMADAIESLLARAEAAERERDRAVEVADAATKGVCSKYMLEAAVAALKRMVADSEGMRREFDDLNDATEEALSVIARAGRAT